MDLKTEGNTYNAVILGATGSVGGEVLQELLKSSRCASITILGRKISPSWKELPNSDKIKAYVIDVEKLAVFIRSFSIGDSE
jgi:hypothetical protein